MKYPYKKIGIWRGVIVLILAIIFIGFMIDKDHNYVAAGITLVLLAIAVFWEKVRKLW